MARVAGNLGAGLAATIDGHAKLATTLGMNEQAYLAAAGAAGQYLLNLGVGKTAAADMAVGMTELAPKLAAFNDMDPQQVTDALQKGIGGATRGLKDLGVVIDANAISKMDAAQRAAYIYGEVLKQTGPAQQGWVDNQGDVANSIATMHAVWDNAKASLGQIILPVLAPLAQDAAALASTLAGALGPVLGIIRDQFSGDWTGNASDRLAALEGALGPIGRVAFEAATAFGQIGNVLKSAFSGDGAGALEMLGSALWNTSDAVSHLLGLDVSGIQTFLFGTDDDPGGAWKIMSAAITSAGAVLGSIGSQIASFLGGPALLMKITIGTVLVVAFGALAAAAFSAAAGVIAALLPILVPIGLIVVAVALLRKAWESNWGGIREKTAAVVAWFTSSVLPAFQSAFAGLQALLAGLLAWWQENGDAVLGYLQGWWNVIAGIFQTAFALVRGIVTGFLALFRGDFEGAGRAWGTAIAGAIAGIGRIIAGLGGILLNGLKLAASVALSAAKAIGSAIIDGIKFMILQGPSILVGIVTGMIDAMILAAKKRLGIASPSKVFALMGEQVVAGLRAGMAGLADLSSIINETLGRIIGDADRENFRSIAELTGSLLDIFVNTTSAIKSLLSFDVSTSAAQISAQFDALIGTFQTALLRMKELSQYAGQSDSPNDYLNFFDVQNIDIVSKGIGATISMIDGLLGIVEKMGSVKMPETGGIAALLPFLQELGNVAAQFIDSVGKPEGEDATAFFTQGATTAAAIAAWAKSIAEIAGLKVGALASDFAVQMQTLASASSMAWDALKATALDWGGMGVSARDRLLTGIKAYAEAIGASTSILKGSAELKIDEATLATTEQIASAARVGNDALTKIGQLADWWVRMPELAERAVAGIKAYVEAGVAAVGLLKAGGDLDLSGATEANVVQLAIAGRNAQSSESLVRALAQGFITAGAAWRDLIVPAVKDWTDSAKASIDILTAGAALAIGDVVEAQLAPLAMAGKNAQLALSLVQGLAQGYVNGGAVWRETVVPAIKDWADSAGAALKLLVDSAAVTTDWSKVTAFVEDGLRTAGDNARAMLQVVQDLATTWAGLGDSTLIAGIVERVKAFADGAGSALRILVDSAGVAVDWSKVTVLNINGMVLAAVNASLMLGVVQRLADAWAGIAAPEVLAAIVTRIKAFADGAGSALRVLVDSAGITTDWAKVTVINAAGLDAAGANSAVLLAAAEGLANAWANGRPDAEMKATADRIKIWGDAAGGAAKAFADAAGSFQTLTKAKWPADLSGAIARVGIAMTAVLGEFSDIYDRLKKQGKDLDKASSVSTLVGGAAEAIGKVFETFSLEKLMKNPLVDSKIRSGWGSQVAARRMDHLALKMADGVKRAVNALINGLSDVVVPTGLASGLDGLVGVYERLLDTLERLSSASLPDASKIAALLAALGYVPGTPAGGGGGAGGGVRGAPVPSGDVAPFTPPAPPNMGTPYQPPSPTPGTPSPTPGPGPSPNITVQLTNEIKIGLEVVARAMQLVSNVKAMQTTHAPVGA